MANDLSALIDAKASWNFLNQDDVLSTPEDTDRYQYKRSFTQGTGDNQIDEMFKDQRDLTTGANDDLDLAGGITNQFGQTVTFTKIKSIFISNLGKLVATVPTPTSGEDLDVGNGGGNSFNDLFNGVDASVFTVLSGGILLATGPIEGWDVTAGTADILRIANPGANTIRYNIILKGLK